MQPPYKKVKFTKTLTEDASGDHPELLYAKEGETGIIGSTPSREGYWAKTDNYETWFGVSADEFIILEE